MNKEDFNNELYSIVQASVTIATYRINEGYVLELTWRLEGEDYKYIINLSFNEYIDLNRINIDNTLLYKKILRNLKSKLLKVKLIKLLKGELP